MTYLILSYLIAVFLFLKSTKYYFPNLANMNNPNFHKSYEGFNRTDGHHVTFGKILYGVLNYFWLKLLLFSIAVVGFYLHLRYQIIF